METTTDNVYLMQNDTSVLLVSVIDRLRVKKYSLNSMHILRIFFFKNRSYPMINFAETEKSTFSMLIFCITFLGKIEMQSSGTITDTQKL